MNDYHVIMSMCISHWFSFNRLEMRSQRCHCYTYLYSIILIFSQVIAEVWRKSTGNRTESVDSWPGIDHKMVFPMKSFECLVKFSNYCTIESIRSSNFMVYIAMHFFQYADIFLIYADIIDEYNSWYMQSNSIIVIQLHKKNVWGDCNGSHNRTSKEASTLHRR
jgi:hypothetical protein